MQGQLLSTHYIVEDESQIKIMCFVISIQMEIVLKWLSVHPRDWSEKEITIG